MGLCDMTEVRVRKAFRRSSDGLEEESSIQDKEAALKGQAHEAGGSTEVLDEIPLKTTKSQKRTTALKTKSPR